MILNIMGLLGVPKLQNMNTLVQRERGNIYVNIARTPGTSVGTFMGSCMGTWEHVRELVWERTSMCGNSFGNVGTCERHGGTSLGTRSHVWDITLASVHCLHSMTIIFIISWHCTTLHNTYVECCMTHLRKCE